MFTFKQKADCYIQPEFIETLVDLSNSLIKRSVINFNHVDRGYLLESCSVMFSAGRQTGQTKEIVNYANKHMDKYFFVFVYNKQSNIDDIKHYHILGKSEDGNWSGLFTSLSSINTSFNKLRGITIDKPLVIFTDSLFEKDRMKVATKIYEDIAPIYKNKDFLHAVVHVGSVI